MSALSINDMAKVTHYDTSWNVPRADSGRSTAPEEIKLLYIIILQRGKSNIDIRKSSVEWQTNVSLSFGTPSIRTDPTLQDAVPELRGRHGQCSWYW